VNAIASSSTVATAAAAAALTAGMWPWQKSKIRGLAFSLPSGIGLDDFPAVAAPAV